MGVVKKTPRILYIDDAAVSRRAISLLFTKSNIDVDTADNGFQGLELLEQKQYDLVITDYEMPLMSGLEVLLVIRHKYSKTELPVITLTGNTERSVIEEFIKFGTNAYLVKSNDLNPLLKKTLELLDKRTK